VKRHNVLNFRRASRPDPHQGLRPGLYWRLRLQNVLPVRAPVHLNHGYVHNCDRINKALTFSNNIPDTDVKTFLCDLFFIKTRYNVFLKFCILYKFLAQLKYMLIPRCFQYLEFFALIKLQY